MFDPIPIRMPRAFYFLVVAFGGLIPVVEARLGAAASGAFQATGWTALLAFIFWQVQRNSLE
jgi:hypothetical protein